MTARSSGSRSSLTGLLWALPEKLFGYKVGAEAEDERAVVWTDGRGSCGGEFGGERPHLAHLDLFSSLGAVVDQLRATVEVETVVVSKDRARLLEFQLVP